MSRKIHIKKKKKIEFMYPHPKNELMYDHPIKYCLENKYQKWFSNTKSDFFLYVFLKMF